MQILLCALVVACMGAAQNNTTTAQTTTVTNSNATPGTLVITVKMSDGAPVAGATVLLQNVDSGYRQQGTTDQSGMYRFNSLPSGRYRLTPSTAQLTGTPSDVINFDSTRAKTVDVSMQAPPTGAVTTAATNIIDSQTSLDMTTPEIRYPRNTKDIIDLPQPNFSEPDGQIYGAYNLSLLNPGVASNNGFGNARGPVVGGQRPTSNNFYVDGMDNNNRGLPGPLVYVPADATSEFIAYQNQFPPELGHTAGGQFDTLVKTGSNGFHGELYDYLQNRNLNAIDQTFARQGIRDLPPYDQNRLGANAGLPIIPNHLYFFGSVEWIPVRATLLPGMGGIIAPTAAGYSALAGMVSPTNLAVLQSNVPAANSQSTFLNVGGVQIPAGYSPILSRFRQDSWIGVGALDWDFTNSDHVRARYVHNDVSSNNNGALLPQFFTPVRDRSLVANVSWYHNFSPLFVNELRAGYSRFDQMLTGGGTNGFSSTSATFPGLSSFPNLSILDANLNLGPGLLRSAGLNTFQGADNMSFTFGRHQVKVGFDYRRYIGPVQYSSLGLGAYAYSSLSGFLFDETPDITAQRTFGNLTYSGNNWDEFAFANDHWQVSPTFTLDLGVTYSFLSVPKSFEQQRFNSGADVPGVLTFRSPRTQNLNFAPIVGIAWSPGFVKDTVFRAGFGMNYDTTYYNFLNPAFAPGFASTQFAFPTAFSSGFFANGAISQPAGGPTTAAQARAMTTSFIPDQRIPYTMQWNAGIEQRILHRFVVDIRYLGVKAVHLPTAGYLNQASPVNASQNLPVYFSMPSQATLDALPNTLAGLQAMQTNPLAAAGFTSPIQTTFSNGWSWYNGLAARATQRFSGGFQFQAAYTWSHLIDNLSGPLFSFPWSGTFSEVQTGKHTSVYDHRQDASLTALWDMGALGGHSFNFVRDVLANFTIGGTYRFETGPELPLFSGVNTGLTAFNGTGGGVFENPNGSTAVGGTGVSPLYNSSGQVVAYQAMNPNARYASGAAGTFSSGNPTMTLDPINNFDVMAIKAFGIRDKFRLELRGDAYNVLNHPQFTLANLHDIGTRNLNLVNLLSPASSSFANTSGLLPSNARTLQVALKLLW